MVLRAQTPRIQLGMRKRAWRRAPRIRRSAAASPQTAKLQPIPPWCALETTTRSIKFASITLEGTTTRSSSCFVTSIPASAIRGSFALGKKFVFRRLEACRPRQTFPQNQMAAPRPWRKKTMSKNFELLQQAELNSGPAPSTDAPRATSAPRVTPLRNSNYVGSVLRKGSDPSDRMDLDRLTEEESLRL